MFAWVIHTQSVHLAGNTTSIGISCQDALSLATSKLEINGLMLNMNSSVDSTPHSQIITWCYVESASESRPYTRTCKPCKPMSMDPIRRKFHASSRSGYCLKVKKAFHLRRARLRGSPPVIDCCSFIFYRSRLQLYSDYSETLSLHCPFSFRPLNNEFSFRQLVVIIPWQNNKIPDQTTPLCCVKATEERFKGWNLTRHGNHILI